MYVLNKKEVKPGPMQVAYDKATDKDLFMLAESLEDLAEQLREAGNTEQATILHAVACVFSDSSVGFKLSLRLYKEASVEIALIMKEYFKDPAKIMAVMNEEERSLCGIKL